MALCLGLSRWAGTRKVKPVWILLKQETVGGSGWSAWFGFIVVCLQVNVFECPVCGHANCLTCKAQHEGSTCRDYQDSLRRRAPVDVAAKKTQKKIEVCTRTYLEFSLQGAGYARFLYVDYRYVSTCVCNVYPCRSCSTSANRSIGRRVSELMAKGNWALCNWA